MRIDWRKINATPPGVVFRLPPVDWADPTHVPLMVRRAVEEIGSHVEFMDDDELVSLETAALDAMPGGPAAILGAVKEQCYAMAAAGGWSDCLLDPRTGDYPNASRSASDGPS